MGDIEDIYADLDADVSEEEFREAVAAKVEQMGGLADEETAAMLIAHELKDGEVSGIGDIKPGQEEVKFIAKVVKVGDLRTFERDGEDEDGRVINVEVADETGTIRITFWDEQAQAVADGQLDVGTVLRIKGRPKEGYNGVEVSVDQAEPDEDVEIDVEVLDTHTIEKLSLGLSDVNLQGKVLDTGTVRTFSRDDGSEGRVANITLGDPTGRIRVTMWDEQANRAEELTTGTSVEVVDGYVRERDGNLELHVGNRGKIEEIDEDVEYVPESTPIADLEIGMNADIGGVVRSADPKRTFDRDDGSEGQVRNIRVQDSTGDIRVALWGEKADYEIAPGDEVHLADVEIKDGWQEDMEASAGWRTTITVTQDTDREVESATQDSPSDTGLSAFAEGNKPKPETGDDGDAESSADGETVEFTGTVVQAGNPVVLDDGKETMSVETSQTVQLGQEITVRGTLRDGRLDASDIF
ncbi:MULTISPECIES: single-stranded DNA binding protein [unclassified Haladaptatus]|uniref:single-stranded DNA binding protein n=1 Tax=unclassified Haladaptatus TaxID=2622732 RepID=UPI0023E82244|nr:MULTISPECIES: single-stranded DNA binding protein [unclassified Haladaptatus]